MRFPARRDAYVIPEGGRSSARFSFLGLATWRRREGHSEVGKEEKAEEENGGCYVSVRDVTVTSLFLKETTNLVVVDAPNGGFSITYIQEQRNNNSYNYYYYYFY